MHKGDWVRALWEGDGTAARAGRAALKPLELAFGAIAGLRGSLYDAGLLATRPTAVPALGIGNLTVGGTGKTPIAAWFARRLRDAGATPAIVLRGYGDDEPRVHRALNPDVEVIVSADRVAASLEAKRRGCDVVVLDDAFQHRRAERVSNVVVISADAWRDNGRHMLPAGPWRERLAAARRASLAIVTRKAATYDRAVGVLRAVTSAANVPTAIVHLAADNLALVGAPVREPLSALHDQSVVAISAIGDPGAFHAQLTASGATITPVVFRDHHTFSLSDVPTLLGAALACDRVVCTLKDAVKLAPHWPREAPPLWYVSQSVVIEEGRDALDALLARVLAARTTQS